VKRTLKRESKVLEIVYSQRMGTIGSVRRITGFYGLYDVGLSVFEW